jgi:hypothetical protein
LLLSLRLSRISFPFPIMFSSTKFCTMFFLFLFHSRLAAGAQFLSCSLLFIIKKKKKNPLFKCYNLIEW